MTTELANKYGLPSELLDLVNRGVLRIVAEHESNKTIEFHVPSLRSKDGEGRITTYSVIWIHPDHNYEFCHYYTEQPGDSPNFYVTRDTTELGDDMLDLDTLADLLDWLNA